jgi:catechol 2,3-dioxygenase-like lactoylglutathione lyase family enzyme
MEQAIPILPADDLSEARRFYVDGLGFSVRYEVTQDGKSGLLGLERNGMLLTIDSPMSGHGRQACVSLQVESVDAYHEEWKSKVAIKRAPKNEEWGARTFSVQDPSDNTIFVMGPIVPDAEAE